MGVGVEGVGTGPCVRDLAESLEWNPAEYVRAPKVVQIHPCG